jgi:ATP-dependent exoDNAse (exonuclease V) alpha subunit
MKQTTALDIMLTGANVFLTGAPGAGKTYVLNQFIKAAEEQGRAVAITASTGIAASHLNGVTIHSWSGLGISEAVTKYDLQKLENNSRVVKRYKKTDVLVIDEISMLHGHRLDMINLVAKTLRKNNRPFGGLQVVLVGDLFQLPPVTRGSSVFDFAHESTAWQELAPKVCYITEQHRQAGTDELLDILQAMRQNTVTDGHRGRLQQRVGAQVPADTVLTRLYSHNVDVDDLNQGFLAKLPGEFKKFDMTSGGDQYKVEQLKKQVLAPETLLLKVNAEVMFVANNFQAGFVNGTRGRVLKFTKAGEPIVKMTSGRVVTVEPHSWKIQEDDRTLAEVTQVPLRLAWAITIHKSQGMSLDAALIDLGQAFTPSMGYVALSRVRSLDGLYLLGLNDMALAMHDSIYEFDAQLLQASEGVA